MIPKSCHRLAEVDFPIAEVSRHAVREKSIRHGHPSTLHLWWARRPLASCRAVLMALLLPDPCDEHCPAAFKEAARHILLAMHGHPRGWTAAVESDAGLRRTLLKFIADFANLEMGRGRPTRVARHMPSHPWTRCATRRSRPMLKPTRSQRFPETPRARCHVGCSAEATSRRRTSPRSAPCSASRTVPILPQAGHLPG